MNDLTCVYYTCNCAPEHFVNETMRTLMLAIGQIPLITISHKPMDFGQNTVVKLERSHFNIYKQAFRTSA